MCTRAHARTHTYMYMPARAQAWDEVERSFFKKALSMCQDVDHHIRIISCNQLAAIARIAGKDVTAKTILPELFELLNDEAVEVGGGAGRVLGWTGGCVGGCTLARKTQQQHPRRRCARMRTCARMRMPGRQAGLCCCCRLTPKPRPRVCSRRAWRR